MGDPEPSPQRERFDRSRQREEREEREEAERLKEREAQKTFWKAFAEEKVARNRSEDAHFKRFLRNLARAVWRFVLPYRPEKRDPQIMAALAARSGVGDGPIIEVFREVWQALFSVQVRWNLDREPQNLWDVCGPLPGIFFLASTPRRPCPDRPPTACTSSSEVQTTAGPSCPCGRGRSKGKAPSCRMGDGSDACRGLFAGCLDPVSDAIDRGLPGLVLWAAWQCDQEAEDETEQRLLQLDQAGARGTLTETARTFLRHALRHDRNGQRALALFAAWAPEERKRARARGAFFTPPEPLLPAGEPSEQELEP